MYPEEDHGANTNWLDEITRTPFSNVHNLSFRGGNTTTNYIANINYNDTEGIMLKSDNKTLSGRIEVTHRLFDDKITIKARSLGKEESI